MRRTATSLVVLVALAGCGSRHDAEGASNSVLEQPGAPPVVTPTSVALDPCTLVDKDDAASVLGGTIGAPAHDADGLQCVYRSTNGGSITIEAKAANYTQTKAALARKEALTEVPQLANTGFWQPSRHMLFTHKGDNFIFGIAVDKPGVADTRPLATDLVQKAIGRMP